MRLKPMVDKQIANHHGLFLMVRFYPYCIVCQQYGVSIESESIVRSSDTEFEYAEFRAVAVDADGKAYSGFGTAHVERGDDPYLLNELAETRAMKRAATWATGVGLTAVEEME